MAECYCHTSTTMHLAELEMRDYIELHREDIEKISRIPLFVTCKNGDTHYFMSEYIYARWCRGRTYILTHPLKKYEKRYHSGLPLKGE